MHVNGSPTKGPIRQALEDAAVVFGFAVLGALIAAGPAFPPSPSVLYGAALAGGFAGLTAYAYKRGIKLGPHSP